MASQKQYYERIFNTAHSKGRRLAQKRSHVVGLVIILLTALFVQSVLSIPTPTLAAGNSGQPNQRATLPPEWTATFTAAPVTASALIPLPTITLGGISSSTNQPAFADGSNSNLISTPDLHLMSEVTGKQVIIDFDGLSLHTNSEESAPIIEEAPRGAVKTILVEAMNMQDNKLWWYIADGYGWIPKEINSVPTTRDYSPDALDQMLLSVDDEMRSDRGNYRLHLQKGWVYYGEKNYGSAIAEITIAIRMMEEANKTDSKDYARLFEYRGKVYLDMMDYTNAIRNFDQALELGYEEASLYNRRALAYQHSGQVSQAIADADKAITLNPSYGLLYNNRAILFDENDPAQLKFYAKAIETDTYFPYAYSNRARYYRRSGDFGDHVINDYTMALSLLPYDRDIRTYRGVVYSNRQQFQLALQDFEFVIQYYPDYGDPYIFMGIMYASMGQNQNAVDALLKATHLDDPEGDAYYNLGVILQRDRQVEAALYCYNKALAENPDRYDAKANRAQIYEMYGGLDESKIMANPNVESLIIPMGQ